MLGALVGRRALWVQCAAFFVLYMAHTHLKRCVDAWAVL